MELLSVHTAPAPPVSMLPSLTPPFQVPVGSSSGRCVLLLFAFAHCLPPPRPRRTSPTLSSFPAAKFLHLFKRFTCLRRHPSCVSCSPSCHLSHHVIHHSTQPGLEVAWRQEFLASCLHPQRLTLCLVQRRHLIIFIELNAFKPHFKAIPILTICSDS